MDALKSRLRAILYPPGTNPLNWKILFIVFCSVLCSAITITILFPFLPAMVKSFGISEEDTGYYAGLVASAMFLGRTLGCYFWGWLADKIGRRPVILISLILSIIGMGSFGLSVSLVMAIITRFVVGLTNEDCLSLLLGVIGTAKAIVSEVSDDTNQALAASVILTGWNMGLIVGPGIGGYLAEPAQKYSSVFAGSFFDKFAFFLPCLLNCGILLISFVLTYFLLPETLVKSESEASTSEIGELALQSTVSSVDNQGDCNQQRLLVDCDKTCKENSSSQEAELEIFVRDADRETTKDGRSLQCTRYGCCWCLSKSKIAILLRMRSAMIAIFVYCVYSFVIIGFDELFSLWAATQAKLGGLGFSTNQIGTALLSVAVSLLFLQMWTYPKFERRLGAKLVFQLANAIMGILVASLSAINVYYDRSTVLWPLLIGILLPLKLSVGCGFNSMVILVNNSVPNDLLGSVNGLAMTASSISSVLSPLFAGSVFAWSISKGYKHGFPLDEHLIFLLFSVVCFLCIVFSCMLPKGLNSRKAVPVRV